MRFVLAFSCFFRLLFGMKLNPEAARYLPEDALPKALPPAANDQAAAATPKDKASAKRAALEHELHEQHVRERLEKLDRIEKLEKTAEKTKVSTAQSHKDGALALLALLQREGRLVDFLREQLDGHSDADIGAAARDVHRGCRKVLEQHLSFEPVMPGAEEEKVSVPKGFDPAEIRLIGEAKGEPPYRGTLRHHGWRVVETKLPSLADGIDRTVVAPAEVELSA